MLEKRRKSSLVLVSCRRAHIHWSSISVHRDSHNRTSILPHTSQLRLPQLDMCPVCLKRVGLVFSLN
ncbi:hypothetical protein DPMN_145609 [Dreissena polymorpha]|uniref:Uncharacterized protein n=1 Tax=Dreissena polymorpha TaxID=45954 RepID=A0A9D4F6D0_DREPO|nr:hypothetical protein DPMN_145609 [Dreissena polymorpha]